MQTPPPPPPPPPPSSLFSLQPPLNTSPHLLPLLEVVLFIDWVEGVEGEGWRERGRWVVEGEGWVEGVEGKRWIVNEEGGLRGWREWVG